MSRSKTFLFCISLLSSGFAIAQEFGVNTTLMLKQVFNLSNNTFTTLPYDLTYKSIRNCCRARGSRIRSGKRR